MGMDAAGAYRFLPVLAYDRDVPDPWSSASWPGSFSGAWPHGVPAGFIVFIDVNFRKFRSAPCRPGRFVDGGAAVGTPRLPAKLGKAARADPDTLSSRDSDDAVADEDPAYRQP